MPVLAILGVIFFAAFLIEALVEYLFGQPFEHFPALKPYQWLLMYVSAAVGVAGAFIYQFDLLSILSSYLGAPLSVTWFGVLLTGLAIGRGSNFLHDAVAKFFVKPTLPA